MTSTLDVVVACEQRLGWFPLKGGVLKARITEAGKLKKKLAEDPRITCEDLMLAVELSVRQRRAVKSPMALFYRVEDAKKLAAPAAPTQDLTVAVEHALEVEYGRDSSDPQRREWIGRLTRSNGEWRREVLAEWEAAGRAA